MKLDDKLEIVVKVDGKIDFKQDEIASMLLALEEHYGNLVLQETDVPRAKKERTELNNYTKTLGRFRKDKMAEATEWLAPFEKFMKESEARSKAVSKMIDEQVKDFEKKAKAKRVAVVEGVLEKAFATNPLYDEFRNYFDLSETIYNSAQSFTTKGFLSKKLVEHIEGKFDQIDEILKARATEKKMLDNKKTIIVQSCAQYSEMMELQTPIDPDDYSHLISLELAEITETLVKVAKDRKLIEQTVVENVKPVEVVVEKVAPKKKTKRKDFEVVLEQLNKTEYLAVKKFLTESGYKFKFKEIN